LTNPQLDKPTGRYYCDPCLEPTVEVQLRLAGKDYSGGAASTPFHGYYDFVDAPEETLTEEVLIKEPKDEDDENF
jgi:hypothetical protein